MVKKNLLNHDVQEQKVNNNHLNLVNNQVVGENKGVKNIY